VAPLRKEIAAASARNGANRAGQMQSVCDRLLAPFSKLSPIFRPPKQNNQTRRWAGFNKTKKGKRLILNEAGFEPAPEDQSLNLAP
jgi:hypothetical protein